ncbi:MAG: hypothetical protein Q4E87_05600, partial [bacterium]|nr:hypothetical protein [bacterium]
YQQYPQGYPQNLCITFSYAGGYPLSTCGKNGFIKGFLPIYQQLMHKLWITLITFSPIFPHPYIWE